MKNPKKDKVYEYRRMLYTGYGPSLHALFNRTFNVSKYHYRDDTYWNDLDYWRRNIAKVKTVRSNRWGVPAQFRRDRNRALRTKQKAALRNAFLKDDWDNFSLPNARNDVDWLYW